MIAHNSCWNSIFLSHVKQKPLEIPMKCRIKEESQLAYRFHELQQTLLLKTKYFIDEPSTTDGKLLKVDEGGFSNGISLCLKLPILCLTFFQFLVNCSKFKLWVDLCSIGLQSHSRTGSFDHPEDSHRGGLRGVRKQGIF